LLEFCSRDATTLRITYTYRGGSEEFIVASAYLPYDSGKPPSSKEMRDIIDYCQIMKKKLFVGCDANAQHLLCGNIGTNPREEKIMEFLVNSNMNILNQGNVPNFEVCNRKKVIDLTPGTNKIGNLVIGMYLASRLLRTTDIHVFK
jgi:hypothetical protein